MGTPADCRPSSRVLETLEHAARAIGVTRVSDLTYLDRTGIRVACAVRDDVVGESVSICTGKGFTLEESWAGALAEALERYCGEPRGRLQSRWAYAPELEQALDPRLLVLASWAPQEPPFLEWCIGRQIGTGRKLWVPANAIFFPYYPQRGELLFAPATHGLAAAATLEQALLMGLCECIERDAYARALVLASVGEGRRFPVVDVERTSPALARGARHLVQQGINLLLRDITGDVRVPTLLCTLSETGLEGLRAHSGCAAHPDPAVAAERAFCEAAQSRIVAIQGAREDLPADLSPPHPWFIEPDAPTSTLSELWPVPPEASMQAVARAIESAGLHPPLYVDLSDERLPLRVVRTIIPEAEVWGEDPERVGRRLTAWIQERSSL